MFSAMLLIVICIPILLYIITLFLLFKRNKKIAAYIMIFVPVLLFIGLTLRDNWAYNVYTKRADMIKKELRVGMPEEQVPSFIGTNKKRLHISRWSRFEYNNRVWFIIAIDGPFNFRCLFTGKGGLVIWLDKTNKKVESINWFM